MPVLKLLFTSKWEINSSSVGKRPKWSNLIFFLPRWDIQIAQNIDDLLTNPLSFIVVEVSVTCTYLPGNHQFSQGHWSSIFRGNPLQSGQSFLLVPRQHVIPGAFWQPLRVTHTHTEKSVTTSNKLWDFPLGEISAIPADSHITQRITELSLKNSKKEFEESSHQVLKTTTLHFPHELRILSLSFLWVYPWELLGFFPGFLHYPFCKGMAEHPGQITRSSKIYEFKLLLIQNKLVSTWITGGKTKD